MEHPFSNNPREAYLKKMGIDKHRETIQIFQEWEALTDGIRSTIDGALERIVTVIGLVPHLKKNIPEIYPDFIFDDAALDQCPLTFKDKKLYDLSHVESSECAAKIWKLAEVLEDQASEHLVKMMEQMKEVM